MNRFNRFLCLLGLLGWALASPALAAVSTGVRQNSVGFLPGNVKRASIFGAATGTFYVRRAADASIAYTGSLGAAAVNADTSESLRPADFSSLTETGSFYLDVAGVGQGPTFAIGPDVYNDPFWAEVMGFYSHRCGTAVSYTWKGQTFGHGACHLNDAYQDSIGGGHVIRDGTHGWHDAGDYGKYTINGAFASVMLLQAWEWHKAVISQWSFPIPESGGAIPDYLAEVKWNLDWLLKMQAANGSAYHKLTTYNFAGFVMPEADTADTEYAPYSSQATADLCGVMSMAARIYAPYNAAFAAQCQAAADKAWTWLQANPAEHLADLTGFGTGAYNEAGTDADHRAFADAEYWETTGNATALADFESRMAADPDLVSTYWDWGEYAYGKRGPKNHGIFTYLLSSRSGRSAATVTALSNDLFAEANAMVATRNAHGYGRPLGTEYHWGSNGTVARQAMLLDCADQLQGGSAYADTALDALGHLFGRNTYDRSFVTGVGYNPPMNPHDRMSASDGITNPVPGHLVGGAESTASSWTDAQGDYTTNEIAINWDAALVAALARFITVPPPATPTPTPTPMPCFSATALRRVNVGGPTLTSGGNTWSADQAYTAGGWGYTGGSVSTNTNAISGTTDDALYQTARYGMGSYQFTVSNGNYRVVLYLAETYFNTAGARVFNVTLEGQPAATGVDVYALAGGANAAVALTLAANVSDGILSLGFTAVTDQPEIKAIAIFPETACPATPTFTPSPNWTATPTPSRTPSFTVSPTRTPSPSVTPTPSLSPTACGDQVVARIHAGGGALTDSLGQAWSADTGYSGGTAASTTNAISGTTDDALYQSERYGNPLSYAVPVPASGTYRVRFLWAETYCAAAGCRVFSVKLEGTTAIGNLDLYASAGANAAYQLTRTVSVTDGVLNIDATSTVDNAKFDAIEVIWQAPACASPTPSATAAPPSPTPSRTPTRSASPSPTPSGSASGTPSPTATRSATASATATASPTASRTASASPSASPTASPTATPSGSPSASPTRSPSPSASATVTPSPTVTVTFLDSYTVSPSVSPSPSRSPTASASATPSASPSASGSPSATRSPSPTLTPSASPSFSVSPSPSQTLSASPTGTWSVTESPTISNSPSATQTPSATPVPTGSSLTPTPTRSPSWTVSPSATATASPTETGSATESPTISNSPSATQTQTPSATASPTRSATATPSASPVPSADPSASPTAVASPSPGPALSPTPADDGPLALRDAVGVPNPVRGPHGRLSVQLDGAAEGLQARIYTRAMVLLREQRWEQALASGWHGLDLDLEGLPSGVLFVSVQAYGGGQRSRHRIVRLLRLP